KTGPSRLLFRFRGFLRGGKCGRGRGRTARLRGPTFSAGREGGGDLLQDTREYRTRHQAGPVINVVGRDAGQPGTDSGRGAIEARARVALRVPGKQDMIFR